MEEPSPPRTISTYDRRAGRAARQNGLDPVQVETPAFVIDKPRCRHPGDLAAARERAGCTILLALKGSMWCTFPIVREHLKGIAASSYGALLGQTSTAAKCTRTRPPILTLTFEVLRLSGHVVFTLCRSGDGFNAVSAKAPN